jgi:hypothetical protein
MKIYLAGPMSNLADFNYPAFFKEAARLRCFGFQVVNPAEIGSPKNDRLTNMRVDLHAMLDCDGIIMMEGWEDAPGASLEKQVMEGLHLPVLYCEHVHYYSEKDIPDAPRVPADRPVSSPDHGSGRGPWGERGSSEDAICRSLGARVGSNADGGGPDAESVLRDERLPSAASQQRYRKVYFEKKNKSGCWLVSTERSLGIGGSTRWFGYPPPGAGNGTAKLSALLWELGALGYDGALGGKELARVCADLGRHIDTGDEGTVFLSSGGGDEAMVAASNGGARPEEGGTRVPQPGPITPGDPGFYSPSHDPASADSF